MKCPKCGAEKKGAVAFCSDCSAYILPRRTTGDRILAFSIGVGLLLAIAFIPVMTKNYVLFWVLLFILGGPMGAAFTNAFRSFKLSDAYAERAKQYIKTEPDQAIADLSKAIELDKTKGFYYVARATVYNEVGKRREAVDDLQQFLELPRRGQRGINVRAVRKKVDELKKELDKPAVP